MRGWRFNLFWNGAGGDGGDGGDGSSGDGGNSGVGGSGGTSATDSGAGGGGGAPSGQGGIGSDAAASANATAAANAAAAQGAAAANSGVGGSGGVSATDSGMGGGAAPGGNSGVGGSGGNTATDSGIGGSPSPAQAFGTPQGTNPADAAAMVAASLMGVPPGLFNTTVVNQTPPTPKMTNQISMFSDPSVISALNSQLSALAHANATGVPGTTGLGGLAAAHAAAEAGMGGGVASGYGDPGAAGSSAVGTPSPSQGIGSDAVAGGTADSPDAATMAQALAQSVNLGGMPGPNAFGVTDQGVNTPNPSLTDMLSPGMVTSVPTSPPAPFGPPSTPPGNSQAPGTIGVPGTTSTPTAVTQAAQTVALALADQTPAQQTQTVTQAMALAQQSMSSSDYEAFLSQMIMMLEPQQQAA